MGKEIRVLSPTAILGYGFPIESFKKGLAKNPDLIAVDAGSTDPGPYYLGAGKSFTDRTAVKRDLKLMLKAGVERKIPVIVGTAGGSGANEHLNWCLDIVREIAKEEDLHFKLAYINSEIDKETLRSYYDKDRVLPLEHDEDNYLAELDEAVRVVGQMGVEPIIEALKNDADVIIAGRVYDPTVFAAMGIMKGFDPGLAFHMGKILECAAIASDPGSGSDCMFGTLGENYFILEPLNEKRRCTTVSVAAHTLYEKSNPLKLHGPGGVLDLTGCNFEQLDERRVKVTGSRFIPGEQYTIKLEAARLIGYRTLSIAGTRDPIMISQIDDIIKAVRKTVEENFDDIDPSDYSLIFKIYGKNGVMGDLEPLKGVISHELGIIIDVVAKTQELANTICSFARSTMLHYGYPGRVATAGNLAFPYSPSDLKAGEVYEFCLNYLLIVDDPLELCSIHYEDM
ncbi:3-methylaspartate ammonia-lyase [Anoxybacter fermentans]|uniref:3-methylaspartate ammonia-lyase n=1 Tax=Anoxybacter fermentans TaxID=1323375 RepID=A0A3S9SYP3_9FIRM|nr:acyclic terpene utilization AtuA family protein [Anoxybacter fermentans]AZR73395.1 3-methylaspartate ammonia-lyase [Anoxybacter fermentans]